MESKKINQLATELTPSLSDLTIIGDPTTGISKKITLSQMASLFTGTVEEYPNLAAFPLVGVADTIYIALDTNVLYRWDTTLTSYVELSPNIINSLVFNDANGFDGTISLVGSVATLTITTALTQGSVGFIGASGALTQDNSNFYWDNSNKRLGINTNAPTTALDAFGSGIIGRLNGTSTNNAFLGFASAGSNKWSIGNVQSDHRFRIYNEATTSELVSVLQTGEVGIGIANPTTKLHIDGGASALIANLDANVSVAKSISFRSDNSNRINLEVSGTESGSNAGANFFIRRYSDAGALIDTPFTITRSTGVSTFGNSVNIGGDLTLTPNDSAITFSSGAGRFFTGGSERMRITSSGDFQYTGNTYLYAASTAGSATINAGFRLEQSTNTLISYTNNTERMRIYSGGEIGIKGAATTEAAFALFTNEANTGFFNIFAGGSGTATKGMKLKVTNGSSTIDAITITSAGNVGVGINTTNAKLYVLGNNEIFNVAGTNATSAYTGYYYNTDTLVGYIGNGSSILSGAASSDFIFRSQGALVYAAGGNNERMRITSGGLVGIANSGINAVRLGVSYGGGGSIAVGIGVQDVDNATNAQYMQFLNAATTAIGSISRNGGLNQINYNTTSDYRLKEDYKDFNGLEKVNAIKVYDHKWIGFEDRTIGVIAHELQEVLPYVVTGEKDAVDENENIKPQQVDYSKIVPVLVKAIQEQQAQIEELKALINK